MADRQLRTTCFTVLLFLAALTTAAPAGEAIRPDPQSLVEDAGAALQRGELDAASALVAELHRMLDEDPRWDPDGTFVERLLPDLDRRLARMRAAIERIEALSTGLDRAGGTPRPGVDPADPDGDLERGRRQATWILEELDRIVATIPAGADRGALVQSPRHAAAVELIARTVLPETAKAVRARFDRLGNDDERVRAVKARMDSLKRQVIAASVERERVEQELAAAHANRDAYRQVLIELIGDDPETADQPASHGLQGVGLALARRIREVWEEVRQLEHQSGADHARLLRQVDCLRLVNEVSVSDGSRDLGVRIDALAKAVESVPLSGDEPSDTLTGATGCMAAIRP